MLYFAPGLSPSDVVDEIARENPEAREVLEDFRRKLSEGIRRRRGHHTLASLRMSRGMSQRELAKIVRTPQAAISRIESGQTDPKLTTLERIAEALGYDLCEVVRAAVVSRNLRAHDR